MESANSVAIPADPNVKLEKNDNESSVDQKLYQSLVGSYYIQQWPLVLIQLKL